MIWMVTYAGITILRLVPVTYNYAMFIYSDNYRSLCKSDKVDALTHTNIVTMQLIYLGRADSYLVHACALFGDDV